MTPQQLAKTECANYQADGTCSLIEPSSLHDYTLPLPAWMSPEQWRELVANAQEKDKPSITADRRTADVLDRTQPHVNRYRLNLYYCPGCGCRVGSKGKLCPDCAGMPFVPEDVNRRCKVARGERCEYFERAVLPLADQASPPDDPRLQARRAEARRAYLRKHDLDGAEDPGRSCPDCGGPLPKGKRLCETCRQRRRRASYRAARNRSSPKRAHKSLPHKGRNSAFRRDRPRGGTPPNSPTSVARQAAEFGPRDSKAVEPKGPPGHPVGTEPLSVGEGVR